MTRTAKPQERTASAGESLVHEGARWLLRTTNRDAGGATGLVPALDKALRIIAYLNERGTFEAALPEIVEATGVTKSHCHAILKTLVAHGWLAFDMRAKTYRLSPGILHYVSTVTTNVDTLNIMRPLLGELADSVGMPMLLAQVLADSSFIVVDKFSANHVVEVSFPIGYRFPRDACAHMRANLAWRSTGEVDAWFAKGAPARYTDRSIVEESAIRSELAATRTRGYARSIGEFTEGLMALAMPIFGHDGRPAYILSCCSLTTIMEQKEEKAARGMAGTIAEIHRITGGRVPRELTDLPDNSGRMLPAAE